MRRRIIGVLLSITLVLGAALVAAAQTTPHVDNREHRQQKRIRHGVRNGSLTKKEAVKLEKQQAKTRRMEAKAKADGTVTAKERVKLNKQLNKTSRHVYKQKHDKQTR